MSTAPIQTTATPLGTLIILPPELRSQIYSHVLSPCYVLVSTFVHHNTLIDPTFADLEILCVSKALNAEVSDRLFSNMTTFAFLIGFRHMDDPLSQPPTREVTRKVKNVEFVVRTGVSDEGGFIALVEKDMVFFDRKMWGDDDIIPMVTASGEVRRRQTIYHPANMGPRCIASVDHFTGSEIERNELLITFRDFDANFHLFMATRFFQTLKKCIGFQTIVMVLEWWHLEEWSRYDEAVVAEKVEGVRMELEQCWGPCEIKDVRDQYTETIDAADKEFCVAFEMVFQPLKFQERSE